MQSLSQPMSATLPLMSRTLARWLPWSVVIAFVVASAVAALIVLIFDRPDWWRGVFAASIASGIAGVVSIIILARVSGRTVDQAITFVMGAAGVRIGLSIIGLIVAVKGFKTPAEPTGFAICGYYAATLLAETALLARSTKSTQAVLAEAPVENLRGSHA